MTLKQFIKDHEHLNDEDAQELVGTTGFQLFRDGNQWCATEKTFVDLMQSQAGFGDTCIEALADLARQRR